MRPAPDALSYLVGAHVLEATPGLYVDGGGFFGAERQRLRLAIAIDIRNEWIARLRGVFNNGRGLAW